ncbi:MAG: type I-E CRISPR-associated protein Cse1/CasA, partial [Oscillospiraceae bacterium]|nr:type I-E CRISPR-associated protein Cse1/CasA [Oscillospiraceae bacterium]
MAHEFNLITEPWIKVLRDSEVMEVSLEDALINAHNYDSLAGELPTQDLSVLRLLLAVLHCSLENMKVNAECEEDIPFIKWESIWQEGCFDAQLIKEYLNSKKDRFWLFDEVHPFYQVAETDEKVSKSVSLAKFNGQLSESDNKTRLFPFISGVTKDKMSYSEAARWLLYANSWADSSSCKSYVDKEKNKDLFENGTKYGWLGKLGNINAVGDNL